MYPIAMGVPSLVLERNPLAKPSKFMAGTRISARNNIGIPTRAGALDACINHPRLNCKVAVSNGEPMG